jgi:hypothetical protein
MLISLEKEIELKIKINPCRPLKNNPKRLFGGHF